MVLLSDYTASCVVMCDRIGANACGDLGDPDRRSRGERSSDWDSGCQTCGYEASEEVRVEHGEE